MTATSHFDPYHKWFGIPAHEQPPNHYRLLRLALFELDAEVIENAYDKEMADLKAQEHGPLGDMVESISRKLIAARNCLHDAQNKETYDAELREELKTVADGEDPAAEQGKRTAIDEAVRAATIELIDEREQLRTLAEQTSARHRQALLDVRRLRGKLESIGVKEKPADDGGTRRRGILRVVAVVLLIVVLPSVTWLAMGGASRSSIEATDPISQVGSYGGQERADNGLKMKFCWCPPGKFTMGSPVGEVGRSNSEDQVEVELTIGFWLGMHEVTQDQWYQVMETKPWSSKFTVHERQDYPATYVSWDEAMEFCRKLTELERAAGRLSEDWQYSLPSDAEWEYACRADSTTAFSFGEDESQLGEFAWFAENAQDVQESYAHQVGAKKPNAWGLHDMHGNVYEWCRDWYTADLPGGTNPEVISSGSRRVDRGGSWNSDAKYCRSAYRAKFSPDDRHHHLGFRVALSLVQ